jgi:hypothetical protein
MWMVSGYTDGNYTMLMAVDNPCAAILGGGGGAICKDGALAVRWNAGDNDIDTLGCATGASINFCNRIGYERKSHNYIFSLDRMYADFPDTIGGVSKGSAIRETEWNMSAFYPDGTRYSTAEYPKVTTRLNLPSRYDWQVGLDTGSGNTPAPSAEPADYSLGDYYCRVVAGNTTINNSCLNGVITDARWTRSAVRATASTGDVENYKYTFGVSPTDIGWLPSYYTLNVYPVMWVSNSVYITCEVWGTPAVPLALTTSSGAECFDSALVSHTVPTTMRVGSAQSFSITMRNTGAGIWRSGQPVHLRTPEETLVANDWWLTSADITSDVWVNGTYTFTYNVAAPSAPGTWMVRQNPVWEGISWIPDQTNLRFSQAITVTNDAPTFSLTGPDNNSYYSGVSGWADLTLSGTVTDFDTQTITAQYQIDGGSWTDWATTASPAIDKAFGDGLVDVGGLGEGSHTLGVRVYDGLLYSGVATRTFVVDKSAPSLDLGTDVDWLDGDAATISVQDSSAGLASLRYAWGDSTDISSGVCSGGADGAGLLGGFSSGSKGLLTSGRVLPPSEGNWTLYVCAVDVVGNIGYAAADYYYHVPLAIDGVSPDRGADGGGTEIRISGQKFIYDGETVDGTLAGLSVVLAVDGDVSPAECVVKSLTVTEIVCETSAHQAGVVDVVVDNGKESYTLEDGYLYVETRLTLLVDNVEFTVSPAGGAEAGYTVATVTTNNPTGYRLSMVADGVDLVCVSNPEWTIPSIANDGGLSDDSWGYGMGSFDSVGGEWKAPSDNAWRKIPVGGNGDVIGSSAAPSGDGGDFYGIYFGAKVSYVTPACVSYGQRVVVTLVGE